MDHEDTITKTRVAIGDVRPGMYIVGLDRSWLQTPFLFHRKLIQSSEEIDQLKRHGIREVVIDPARGVDIAELATTLPLRRATLRVLQLRILAPLPSGCGTTATIRG